MASQQLEDLLGELSLGSEDSTLNTTRGDGLEETAWEHRRLFQPLLGSEDNGKKTGLGTVCRAKTQGAFPDPPWLVAARLETQAWREAEKRKSDLHWDAIVALADENLRAKIASYLYLPPPRRGWGRQLHIEAYERKHKKKSHGWHFLKE